MKNAIIILLQFGILSCANSQTIISREKALDDFLFLRNSIEEVHPNRFFFRTNQQEDSLYQALIIKISKSLPIYDFYDIVAEYTTFFKNGHTFPSMKFLSNGYQNSLESGNTIMPFQIDFREDYLFISGVFHESHKHLIGKKLLSLNEQNTEHILAEFQKFYSKKAHQIDNAHVRMFKEYFWRAFGAFSTWQIEYIENDGKVKSLILKGLKASISVIRNEMNSSRENIMEPYAFKYILEDKIGILTVNFMANPKRFESFAKKIFSELDEKKTEFLIIDMRRNGGGTSQVGDILYSYLSDSPYFEGRMFIKTSQPIKDWYQRERKEHPLYELVMSGKLNEIVLYPDTSKAVPTRRNHLFKGKSYLITGKKTYSSGHMFAGIYKCGNIGTVIGQETGQATKTPGDAFSFTLPNSKIDISVSYKIFEGPCEISYQSGFRPHFTISYDDEELEKGIDKEIQFIKKLVQEN